MNQTYIGAVADAIREEIPPDLMPAGNVDLLFLIYAVLALAIGEATTAKDVHNAWSAWMTALGEEHESLVPFSQLPEPVRDEDEPFVRAIQVVARRLALP